MARQARRSHDGKKLPDSVYEYRAGDEWLYYFKYRDSRGKTSTKRGFTSPRAATKAREELMGNVHKGEVQIAGGTFADWWERWLRLRRPRISEGTWEGYEVIGRRRLVPEFGHKKLTAVRRAQIEDWMVDAWEAGDLAPKTLNNAFVVLRTALQGALHEQLIPFNPAAGVEKLPLGLVERPYLKVHEIQRYLDACDPIYRPLAHVLIGTGMRISESLGLRWDDILLTKRLIRVERQHAHGHLAETKGKRARTIEVGPALVAELRDLRARAAEALSGDLDRVWVFPKPTRERRHDKGAWAPDGEPMDRNTVSRAWHPAAIERAGLAPMPLHSLRHTAAAAWLYTDQPLVWVQRQLGHSSITTTEQFYGHLQMSALKSNAAAAETAIAEAARIGVS